MNITNLTGPLTFPMTNDYLFHSLLQQNNKVLKGLISSLLHLPLEEIISAEITNPIELGTAIDSKTFFLDIKVLLNGDTTINLEMQVVNEANWIERSLSYLCRSFDDLGRGESYIEVKSVVQINFLDFTLFPDNPEFYATYQLLNVKNYIKYSDKLRLCVLDLTHIDLATKEDKHYQIDLWAALFKATTWEELKMLAEKNESIAEAVETIVELLGDKEIRLQYEARIDYLRRQRDAQILRERQEKQEQELKQQEQELKQQEQELKQQEQELKQQEQELKQQEQELKQQEQELKQQMQEQERKMREQEHKLQEMIEQNRKLIAENEKFHAKQIN